MFCNVIGEEKAVHSGWKEKAKVGQESKYNEDEAKQIVSVIIIIHDGKFARV